MGKVEFTDNSAKFLAKLEREVDRSVGASSDFLAQTIQDQMPGQGAAKDGKKYTPSTPGSPPGVRTNRLKAGITSQKNGTKMSRSVGTNVKYARIQEFGGTFEHPGGTAYVTFGGRASFVSASKSNKHIRRTKAHSITLPARPFMQPGMNAAKKPMLRVFINTLKRGMK